MADDLGDEWWTQGDNSGNINKYLQLYFTGSMIFIKIRCVIYEFFKPSGFFAPL